MPERNVEILLPVSVIKDRIKGKHVYVAESPLFPVASQGDTIDEAIEHLKEALRSYWKNSESAKLVRYTEIVFSGQVNMTVPTNVLQKKMSTV